jgi:large subunit ribosomal protein L29
VPVHRPAEDDVTKKPEARRNKAEANMSLKEFQEKTPVELKERDAELRQELFELRTQLATEKVKDTSQFQKVRKDIARIATLRRQQEIAAQKK